MNGTQESEQWRAIPGYEGLYEVSDQGRVRGTDRIRIRKTRWGTEAPFRVPGKVLKNSLSDVSTYYRVSLHKNDGSGGIQAFVHHLVMLAFVGERPLGLNHIRHLNGNPLDNRLENLVYGTASENAYDRVRHGTYLSRYTGVTHCPEGHPYVPKRNAGFRFCPICDRAKNNERNRAKRERFLLVQYDTKNEIWHPIEGYEGLYSVSDQGRVRSERQNKVMKPGVRGGQPYVFLSNGRGPARPISLNQLVAATFIGPRPTGSVIGYLNSDSLDLRAANLFYKQSNHIRSDRE